MEITNQTLKSLSELNGFNGSRVDAMRLIDFAQNHSIINFKNNAEKETWIQDATTNYELTKKAVTTLAENKFRASNPSSSGAASVRMKEIENNLKSR